MSNNTERAWTCINRWRRRGYVGQVEIFEEVMAENERLRSALRDISLMDKRHEHDLFSATRVAQAALEGKSDA